MIQAPPPPVRMITLRMILDEAIAEAMSKDRVGSSADLAPAGARQLTSNQYL